MIYKKISVIAGIFMIGITSFFSMYFSRAIVNREKYPMLGVDVSSYQGEIDWKIIENQGIEFAFIKATEGSGMTDEYIRRNLENIADTNIYHSAYHFFSFDSAGETQADNYISAVGKDEINLPPVIDIEFYGDKFENQPSRNEVYAILSPLTERLENYYGEKPIIYITSPLYFKYIANSPFEDYPIWIRNVNSEPFIIDWDFWQFSDKGMLEGYYGKEKYIDLNVYNGDKGKFIAEMTR